MNYNETKPVLCNTGTPKMDMLRFTTAGSVDDGKSTLIGRLLYDSKSIFEDQWEALETSSKNRGNGDINLALLTDGLRAEREQGITIDVAYRYFATPRRKFIISDTPGHTQYTRNMVTGASTADLAIILVDARKGVLTQSRRHAFISSLLQIPHIVVAVNKMDLTGYDEQRFNEIVDEFKTFSSKLEVNDVTFIPISALNGDNIVNSSEHMPWYRGSTLLHHLEHVNVESRQNLTDFRYPVQFVVRPDQDFRGFAGRIASGTIRPGDEIIVLPSRQESRIQRIVTPAGDRDEASAGDSVVLTISDNIDISRGDMIVRKSNIPRVGNRVDAFLCWMDIDTLQPDKRYLFQQNTRVVQASVKEIVCKINVDTLHTETADSLDLNEIGRVRIETTGHVYIDPYKLNNETGRFILIDPTTNVTVGAGMIRPAETELITGLTTKSDNVVWESVNIPLGERERRNGHKALLLWFTGISGAGKSTIARSLERQLWDIGLRTALLDGDHLRHGLCGDLGFKPGDRSENIRRAGYAAKLLFEQGNIVLCTFVSPNRNDRQFVKSLFPDDRFHEIHVHCKQETAIQRDPKGLYQKAMAGEIIGLTGFDSEYEEPADPSAVIDTGVAGVEECVARLQEMVLNSIKPDSGQ